MDTLIQFFHNLQALIEPARVFVHYGTAASSTASSSATSSGGADLGGSFRIILVDVIRIILWGIGLVRELLVKVLDLLT